MKKGLAALLAGMMVLSAPMSTYAGGISISDNRSKEATAEFADTDFETKGYLYTSKSGSVWYFVGVTNNSEAIVEIKGNAEAKDEAGSILGTDTMGIDILGPGETSIGYFYFGEIGDVKTVDYSLSYERESYYKPVNSNLSVDAIINDSGITVSATNNGEYVAQFVEVYALFLDAEGNVVDYDDTYLTDGDHEIKTGATISGTVSSYNEYSNVELYITGRSDGSANTVSSFDASQIDVVDYILNTSYSSCDYLVITNNSEETIALDFNGIAKDAEGNIVGADDADIDVIGPGETTITYFYFSDVTNVDSVEYTMTVDSDPYYSAVINGLSTEVTLNPKNIIVQVTNNAEAPAKFVEACCLLFDADGNLVDVDDTYITDSDYEIKSGATLSGQINVYSDYDHVEIYLTGRADK